MRVSELAKELGYKAAELIELAKTASIHIENVRSEVDGRKASAIRSHIPHRRDLKGRLLEVFKRIQGIIAASEAASSPPSVDAVENRLPNEPLRTESRTVPTSTAPSALPANHSANLERSTTAQASSPTLAQSKPPTDRVVRRITRLVDRSQHALMDVWAPQSAAEGRGLLRAGRLFQTEPRRALASEVVRMIDGARDVVLVSSFLLADRPFVDAIRRAAGRDVRVYLLVASEHRIGQSVKSDDGFDQRVSDEHKALLNELTGWTLVRTAEHFHAKFVIADPSSRPRGFLLTCNLTTEALERNVELGIELKPDEVRALSQVFSWAFWEAAQHELQPNRLATITPAKRVALPAKTGSLMLTAGESRSLLQEVLQLLRTAQHRLSVATFGLGHEEAIEALADRARHGVEVALLVRDSRPALIPTLRRLSREGVRVLGVPWIHAKAIIADGQQGLIMTANLEDRGLSSGFEVGLNLDGADAQDLDRILASWCEVAPYRYKHELPLGELDGAVRVFDGKSLVDVTITARRQIDCGTVSALCCTRIEDAVPAAPPEPAGGEQARVVECTWHVELPRLKRGAKPVVPASVSAAGSSEPQAPFPIYLEPDGRRVIVVSRPDDVPLASAHMHSLQATAVVLGDAR